MSPDNSPDIIVPAYSFIHSFLIPLCVVAFPAGESDTTDVVLAILKNEKVIEVMMIWLFNSKLLSNREVNVLTVDEICSKSGNENIGNIGNIENPFLVLIYFLEFFSQFDWSIWALSATGLVPILPIDPTLCDQQTDGQTHGQETPPLSPLNRVQGPSGSWDQVQGLLGECDASLTAVVHSCQRALKANTIRPISALYSPLTPHTTFDTPSCDTPYTATPHTDTPATVTNTNTPNTNSQITSPNTNTPVLSTPAMSHPDSPLSLNSTAFFSHSTAFHATSHLNSTSSTSTFTPTSRLNTRPNTGTNPSPTPLPTPHPNAPQLNQANQVNRGGDIYKDPYPFSNLDFEHISDDVYQNINILNIQNIHNIDVLSISNFNSLPLDLKSGEICVLHPLKEGYNLCRENRENHGNRDNVILNNYESESCENIKTEKSTGKTPETQTARRSQNDIMRDIFRLGYQSMVGSLRDVVNEENEAYLLRLEDKLNSSDASTDRNETDQTVSGKITERCFPLFTQSLSHIDSTPASMQIFKSYSGVTTVTNMTNMTDNASSADDTRDTINSEIEEKEGRDEREDKDEYVQPEGNEERTEKSELEFSNFPGPTHANIAELKHLLDNAMVRYSSHFRFVLFVLCPSVLFSFSFSSFLFFILFFFRPYFVLFPTLFCPFYDLILFFFRPSFVLFLVSCGATSYFSILFSTPYLLIYSSFILFFSFNFSDCQR